MNSSSSKVIRASAGTGKTYRLSLEFISILLRFREEISFEEILVITFTRKATYEIRERIFSHLEALCKNSDSKLIDTLKSIDPGIELGQEEIEYLKRVRTLMLTNKSRLNISTIDSFITRIFTSLIAPYLKLENITIDPEINKSYLPEIFEKLLTRENLEKFRELYLSTGSRNLMKIDALVLQILELRWLLGNLSGRFELKTDLEQSGEKAYQDYCGYLTELLKSFQSYLKDESSRHPDKGNSRKFFKTPILEIIKTKLDIEEMNPDNVADQTAGILKDEETLIRNYKVLLKSCQLWHGNNHLKKDRHSEIKTELINLADSMKTALADWMFYRKLIPEMKDLIELSGRIYEIYDEIKFRDRIFDYQDLTYYTYKYLYDPEISIIDPDNVLNLFYEFLSYRFRYILIDEFQDTSIMQWNIIYPLIREISSGSGQKDYGGMVVVGDEKQSIYGWRGGEKELLAKISGIRGSDHKDIKLTQTYRCGSVIQDFINRIFSHPYLHHKLEELDRRWTYDDITSADPGRPGKVEVDIVSRAAVSSEEGTSSKLDIYRYFVRELLKPGIDSGHLIPERTAVLTRKNRELKELALVLDEFELDYIIESTAPVSDHRAVKPIMFLLRFLAFGDSCELIKFLRSDLVLTDGPMLRKILRSVKTNGLIDLDRDGTSSKVLEHVERIRNKSRQISLLNLVKAILEEFNICRIFGSELDSRNIHRFMEIAAEFEISDHEYPRTTAGFVNFCEDNKNKEEFMQTGISRSGSINLLTIHRSKGLEFDNVFFIQDLNARMGSDHNAIYHAESYDSMFREIDYLVLTLNYSEVLKESSFGSLYDQKVKKEFLEELNNIYVGCTRAKYGLNLFFHYKNDKELPTLVKEMNRKYTASGSNLFFLTLYESIKPELEQKGSGWIFREGSWEKQDREESGSIPELSISSGIHRNFSLLEPEMLEERTGRSSPEELSYQYLKGKNLLIGNLVHFYLSRVEFDSKEARKKARDMTISLYGAMLARTRLNSILDKVEEYLDLRSDLFSRDSWDVVYTEYLFYDPQGSEYRIDRLMVDHKQKKISIVDFKTGSIRDSSQLENYRNLISGLEFVRRGKYTVEYEYCNIEIDV